MKSLVLVFILSIGLGGEAAELHLHFQSFPALGQAKGDILYLHGYGDQFENHLALFKAWRQAGFRVLPFDLPSHGQTYGSFSDDLEFFSFSELVDLAAHVDRLTREDSQRPFFLAGWSTGGLLALRIAQVESFRNRFRPLAGLILYAPGVAVKKCVGDHTCHITNQTLTHDSGLFSRAIKPSSPLSRPDFALRLLANAELASLEDLPLNLPVLLFIGGAAEDKYVKSEKIKKWALRQKKRGAQITGFQCLHARHELDNELPEYGGEMVRRLSAAFVEAQVNHLQEPISIRDKQTCEGF